MAGIDRIRARILGARVWNARNSAGVRRDVLAHGLNIPLSDLADLENGTHPQIEILAPRALRALAQQPAPSRITSKFTQHLN